MNVRTLSYVSASEVFDDCDAMWEWFVESEPDFSWGNNSYSLVSVNELRDALEEAADDDELAAQWQIVSQRLDSVPETVYIDLES